MLSRYTARSMRKAVASHLMVTVLLPLRGDECPGHFNGHYGGPDAFFTNISCTAAAGLCNDGVVNFIGGTRQRQRHRNLLA